MKSFFIIVFTLLTLNSFAFSSLNQEQQLTLYDYCVLYRHGSPEIALRYWQNQNNVPQDYISKLDNKTIDYILDSSAVKYNKSLAIMADTTSHMTVIAVFIVITGLITLLFYYRYFIKNFVIKIFNRIHPLYHLAVET